MATPFKIHCIALTKNEADVVALCLTEAAQWADYIYVYDGQSTDGTWEIIESLHHPRIIPWKQDGKVYKEGLRAEVFNAFRHQSREGDWWLQLNVDEFYAEDTRQFFAALPNSVGFVWGINVEYYLTKEDLRAVDFTAGFATVRPLLRHYRAAWSEPRAFRFRPRLVWSPDWAWPRHPGLVAKNRLVFKHYPYRSPGQVQTRLDVRRDNRARGFRGWEHARETHWEAKIVSPETCDYDDGHSPLRISEDKLPRHLEPAWMRCVKRVMHGTGLWP